MNIERQINDAFAERRFETIWHLRIADRIGQDQNRFGICEKVALSLFVLADGLAFNGNEEDVWIMLQAQKFAQRAIYLSSKVATVSNESYENIVGLSILIDYALSSDLSKAKENIAEIAREERRNPVNPLWDFILALVCIDAGDIEQAWKAAAQAKKSVVKADKVKDCKAELATVFRLLSLIGADERSSYYSRRAFDFLEELCSPTVCPWLLFINKEHIRKKIAQG